MAIVLLSGRTDTSGYCIIIGAERYESLLCYNLGKVILVAIVLLSLRGDTGGY